MGIINFKEKGGEHMVQVTKAALTAITNEVKDLLDEGKKPLIRLSMGIG